MTKRVNGRRSNRKCSKGLCKASPIRKPIGYVLIKEKFNDKSCQSPQQAIHK